MTELALWRKMCACAKYKSVHGKFASLVSSLTCANKKRYTGFITVSVIALLVHYGLLKMPLRIKLLNFLLVVLKIMFLLSVLNTFFFWWEVVDKQWSCERELFHKH